MSKPCALLAQIPLAGIVNLWVACFKNRAYTRLHFADDSPVNDRLEEQVDCFPHRSRLRSRIMLFLLIAASSANAQANSKLSEQTTFVFVQKTSGVAKLSSPNCFHI